MQILHSFDQIRFSADATPHFFTNMIAKPSELGCIMFLETKTPKVNLKITPPPSPTSRRSVTDERTRADQSEMTGAERALKTARGDDTSAELRSPTYDML